MKLRRVKSQEIRRPDGSTVRFDDNSAVTIEKNNEPIGRPRQVYIGENFREFVPVENR